VIWVVYYTLWAITLVLPGVRKVPLGRPSLPLFRRSLSFGVRAWVGGVASVLNYRTDQVLMGFIATQAALGIYVVAVNASEILLILPMVATTALLPVLARSGGSSRVERTLCAFRLLSVTTIAASIVFGAVGASLLPLVFGSNYRSAVGPFLWLVAGAVGFVASQVFTEALLTTSSPGLASVSPAVSLVVDIALDVALIPSMGATGAAVAAAAAFLSGGLTAFVVYRLRVPFSYRLLVPVRSDLELTRSVVARLALSSRRRAS
jgi:O-antigen/teichoic acid export membrane protein